MCKQLKKNCNAYFMVLVNDNNWLKRALKVKLCVSLWIVGGK